MNVAGFARLVALTPAPVIPVFSDDGGKNLYVQVIDVEGKIYGFSPMPTNLKERLILNQQTSSSYPIVQVGDFPLYAFETESKKVAVRQGEEFRVFLRQLATAEWGESNYFLLLEIGKYLGDQEMISDAAKKCVRSLAKKSTKFAESWAKSSIEDNSLISMLIDEVHSIGIKTTQTARINFVGSEYVLRAMDEWSRRKGLTRAAAVRAAFDPENFLHHQFLDIGPQIANSLWEVYSRSSHAEQILMTYYRTKGAIRVNEDMVGLFSASRVALRKSIRRTKSYEYLSRMGISNGGMGVFGGFVLICGLAALDSELMLDLLSFNVSEVVDKRIYQSVVKAYDATKPDPQQ